jgi:nicotinamidase-related amidase
MRPPPPAALVCLDLQRGRLTNAVSPSAAERTAKACRLVLNEARRRSWPILHVHRREPDADGARPIAGLEPLPSEPVYVRSGPSAFSHARFTQAALALGGPLALIGFSLCDSVLATAFAAADRKLPVEILQDAVAIDARDEYALRLAMAAPITSLSPLCRMIASEDLFQEDVTALAAANAP